MSIILRLIIINIIALNINGENVRLNHLFAGDTVNINNLSLTSTKFFDTIFNSFSDGNIFITTKEFLYYPNIVIHKEICSSLDSLKSHLYPTIYSDDVQLNSSAIFHNSDTANYDYFNFDEDNFNENLYSFGLIKVCRVIKNQILEIHPIPNDNLPIINGNIIYKIQKLPVGVLRFRRNNETHYLSTITSGNCVFQIFVNHVDYCKNYDKSQLNMEKLMNFFDFSVFKSGIASINTTNNRFQVNRVLTENAAGINHSLHSLSLSLSHYMANHIENENIIELALVSLPELPELSKEDKRLVTEELDVKPGDIIDQYDLRRISSNFKDNNVSFNFTSSAPMTAFTYSNCYQYDNDTEFLITSKFESYHYELNLFNKMVMEKNYGVDPKYLNDNYKCYKMTICSQFQGPKPSEMPSPIKVINLDRFINASNEYNVMYDDNIVMRLSDKTKLYYVSRMEYGDCLFQALIYPSSTTVQEIESYNQLPVYRGHIISASDNRALEALVKNLITRYEYSIDHSLLDAKDDILRVLLPIIYMLTDKVLINLYLSELN